MTTKDLTVEEWQEEAEYALTEAHTMCDALESLIASVCDGELGGDPRIHPTLEAMRACVQRMERVVEPILSKSVPRIAA